jgi:hypothetical protein
MVPVLHTFDGMAGPTHLAGGFSAKVSHTSRRLGSLKRTRVILPTDVSCWLTEIESQLK